MRRLILIASFWALVASKPEMYKEKEDFQYSRSSSDAGTKAGFYGAQRGNMGGNYERAHNMDSLAQHQMSTLVRNVDGELGEGANTRTGNVFAAANSRGLYGSGNYDLSNLRGRNFGEGTISGDSLSQSALAQNAAGYSGYSGYGSEYSAANKYSSSRAQSSGLSSGYQSSDLASKYSQIDAQKAADYGARNYGYDSQGTNNYKYAQSSSHARSNYDNINSANSDHKTGSSLTYATPVRVYIRPGTRIAIPVSAQVYDANAVQGLNTVHSGSDILDTTGQQLHYKPTNNAKHYESAYSYRKQWEKHDTIPVTVAPTEIPVPTNNELYEDAHLSQAASNQYESELASAAKSHASSANSAYLGGYSSSTKNALSSQSQHQSQAYNSGASTLNAYNYGTSASNAYDAGASSSNAYKSGASDSNTYTHNAYDASLAANLHSSHISDGTVNSNNLIEDIGSRPKSYHSSYSYHKSWERRGDPYIIKPVGEQSSQRLTAASAKQGYACTYCLDDSQQRVRRSLSTDDTQLSDNFHDGQKDMGQQLVTGWEQEQDLGQQAESRWQNLADLGQQTQNQWDELGNFNQQPQSQLGNLEDLGQQTQNQWDKLEDLGQQRQNQWGQLEDLSQQTQDKLEDLGQQTQTQWDNLGDLSQQTQGKLEDLGQQTQSHWGTLEDLGQQTQNQWDNLGDKLNQQTQSYVGKLEDLGQQTPSDKLEDLGQQTQTQWDKLGDLSQQTQGKSEDLGLQTQSHWGKLEDLGQQTQNQWDNLGDLSQHTQGKLEDLGQQTQSHWGKLEDLGQQTQNQWDNLGDKLNQQTQSHVDKLEDLGQQTPSDKLEDLGQQTQTQWDKLGDLSQQTQGKSEDLGQQTQSHWGKLEDLGQQTQNQWDNLGDKLNQQTQSYVGKLEDLGQQIQTQWDKLGDFGQQTQNNWENHEALNPQTQSHWGELEDLGQQTQNSWDKFESVGQQSLNKWSNLDNPDLGQHGQSQNEANFGQETQNTASFGGYQFYKPWTVDRRYVPYYTNHKKIGELPYYGHDFLENINKRWNCHNLEHGSHFHHHNFDFKESQDGTHNSDFSFIVNHLDHSVKPVDNTAQSSEDKPKIDANIQRLTTTIHYGTLEERIPVTTVKPINTNGLQKNNSTLAKIHPIDIGRGDIGPEDTWIETSNENKNYRTPEEIESLSLTKKQKDIYEEPLNLSVTSLNRQSKPDNKQKLLDELSAVIEPVTTSTSNLKDNHVNNNMNVISILGDSTSKLQILSSTSNPAFNKPKQMPASEKKQDEKNILDNFEPNNWMQQAQSLNLEKNLESFDKQNEAHFEQFEEQNMGQYLEPFEEQNLSQHSENIEKQNMAQQLEPFGKGHNLVPLEEQKMNNYGEQNLGQQIQSFDQQNLEQFLEPFEQQNMGPLETTQKSVGYLQNFDKKNSRQLDFPKEATGRMNSQYDFEQKVQKSAITQNSHTSSKNFETGPEKMNVQEQNKQFESQNEELTKSGDDISTPIEPTTEKPGFWGSAWNKTKSATDSIASWFRS